MLSHGTAMRGLSVAHATEGNINLVAGRRPWLAELIAAGSNSPGRLASTVSQRAPFDPDAATNLRPGTRDGGDAFARPQQRGHLFAQRATAIQFSLPIDGTRLNGRYERQQHRCGECFLHVSTGVTLVCMSARPDKV